MASFFFWCSAFALIHTYFLYPFLLVLIDRIGVPRFGTDSAGLAETELPTVSLIVAAYNEEKCIGEKISNSFALDYPSERFEMIVGSDGSTDATDAIVRTARYPRLRLSTAPRAGKTSVLNRCIPNAVGEIIILSDANTLIDGAAIRQLVGHFQNPQIGAVCGKLKLYNKVLKDYEESAYWHYESFIKRYEGYRGAVIGANGGLYAIRRRLFTPLPRDTIVDDFLIALRILLLGYKVVYEPSAIALEETTEDYGREFGRRARIAAGNFQSLRTVPGLLSPFAGFPAFAFWSHKVLRWFAPLWMFTSLISNLRLLTSVFYTVTLCLQVSFYGLALAGKHNIFKGRMKRIASVAYYFVTMNLAMAVGFWRFARSAQTAAWEPTARG